LEVILRPSRSVVAVIGAVVITLSSCGRSAEDTAIMESRSYEVGGIDELRARRIVYMNDAQAFVMAVPGEEPFALSSVSEEGEGLLFCRSSGWFLAPTSGAAYDLHGRRIDAEAAGQPGDIYGLTFRPDGSMIATGAADGTVRLFDTASGQQRLVLQGPTGVGRVAFSADGSLLASTSGDGTVRVWALDIDDLIAIARRNVTRSFTDEECRQYLHMDRCPPP
jgi:WD40 repeat protein